MVTGVDRKSHKSAEVEEGSASVEGDGGRNVRVRTAWSVEDGHGVVGVVDRDQVEAVRGEEGPAASTGGPQHREQLSVGRQVCDVQTGRAWLGH